VNQDVLGRAVRTLPTCMTAEQVLEALAGLTVPALGDWCLADLFEPPDLVTRVVALGGEGPLTLPAGLGGVGARRSSAAAKGLLATLVDAPGRLLHLGAPDVAAMAASSEPTLRHQGELAQSLGTADALILGLVNGDVLLGVLVLGRQSGGFDPAEVDLLSDLASLAALALDGVRLLGVQRSVSTALQRSLLPRLPVVPGVTLEARYAPAGDGLAVGGDWYDAFALPSGELAVVVGDATGHDVQAATRMAELRTLLRALAVDRNEPPATSLGRLDQVLAHLAPELSGTCLYATLEGGRRLRWSSAGHLPPVLLRDGRAELLETPPDLMLGVEAVTVRHDHQRDLMVGDVLLLYTDGLVEDRRTSLDDRLELLLREVEAVGAANAQVLADRLVQALASGEDDVAVLVLCLDATT